MTRLKSSARLKMTMFIQSHRDPSFGSIPIPSVCVCDHMWLWWLWDTNRRSAHPTYVTSRSMYICRKERRSEQTVNHVDVEQRYYTTRTTLNSPNFLQQWVGSGGMPIGDRQEQSLSARKAEVARKHCASISSRREVISTAGLFWLRKYFLFIIYVARLELSICLSTTKTQPSTCHSQTKLSVCDWLVVGSFSLSVRRARPFLGREKRTFTALLFRK